MVGGAAVRGQVSAALLPPFESFSVSSRDWKERFIHWCQGFSATRGSSSLIQASALTHILRLPLGLQREVLDVHDGSSGH